MTKVPKFSGGKPFAVLETGFLAEDFIHPTMGLRVPGKKGRMLIPGGEKSQALYTKILLEESQQLNAVFVSQWVVHDLDVLFDKIAAGGGALAEPMWRLVQDAGMYDERGRARRACAIWDAWLAVPHR